MADSAGRLPKDVFIGTSAAFFGMCIVSSFVRFYIRFRIQKEIGWDDGFLMFGLCCLISGMVMLFTVMDDMYGTEAVVFGKINPLKLDMATFIPKSVKYRKMSAAALTLMWCSICSVKFSFLMLFKRLIRQMPRMIKYWWFAFAFNVIVSAYGVTVYLVSCPYFGEAKIFRAMQCVQGSGLADAMSYSISQMVLDIAGDLFILVIPIILIWQIRIHWTQKIALILTLCLTIVMIGITIARIVGLKWQGKLDSVWETYFIAIGAEIGLTLVAITAFRALYISKAKNRHVRHTITTFNWYQRGRTTLLRIASKVTGKTYPGDVDEGKSQKGFIKNDIPHATMTGMRTLINENGRTSSTTSLA